jgi:light-regulated signal transduction histidine kinase (bacteriophytochrome)
LQEPLRMITSFSQIIQRRYLVKFEDESASKDFAFVIDGAKRMSTLIKDMLEYSRWSAKTLPVESVDMSIVLVEVLHNLTIAMTHSKAEILTTDLPTINVNRLMLAQVFQNIISNAMKYRHPDRIPKIEIKVEDRADDTLISIKDNGIGFEEKESERIFGIFQRLHTERTGGNGIGLAICKRIVEKQGGTIWSISTPDVGSTFYFTIPKLVVSYEL